MRIYFSGCHSSGKTTCARYVSEKYKIPMITEVARMILSEKELQIDSLRYNMKLVNEYQSSIFHRQIVEESKFNSFTSDRSLVDSLAYSSQYTTILSDLINSPMLPDYLEKLKDSDSFVFLVRPSKATLKSDGVREIINWDAMVAIDAQIKLLYEMYGIRYFNISSDSMQERVRLIEAVIPIQK